MSTKTKTDSAFLTNVVVIEDDNTVSSYLAELVNNEKGLSCTGRFRSCEDFLKNTDDLDVDIILMDIGLPGMSGIEGTKIIKDLYPSIGIIVLTIYDDDEKIFSAIKAGAEGYLLKNTPAADLVKALLQCGTGAPLSPGIAKKIVDSFRQNISVPVNYKLTSREKEILELLSDGLSYKKIADILFLSPLTVHSHIKRIYEKLQVHSKAEAVAKALKNNIVKK